MAETASIDENTVSCLDGAFDMHVHSAPDIMPRKSTDIELAQMAKNAHLGGFVIKSHYHPTAERAFLVNNTVGGTQVIGSICLNSSVGGLNPVAVDVLGRSGGKIVWMPTVDSENEANWRNKQPGAKLPYWAVIQKELIDSGLPMPPVALKNGRNQFSEPLIQVLEIIRKRGLILATGHIAPSESIELVEFASGLGLRKFIVTHPEFPTTDFTLEEQKKLASWGAMLERCYTTPATGKTTWEYVLNEVEETGIGSNILSTDLGQPQAKFPVEGLREFTSRFLKDGFSVEEVRKMTVENQKELLG